MHSGTHLATASGDGTVKLWSLAEAKCVQTYSDHAQAVWCADWHWTGDFVASGSMDQTLRLLDVNTGKCRQTFRGHVDSVNVVEFMPYANMLCSASADKTISLWDMRTGLCVQVLDGHNNAVLHAAFNLQGDSIVSSDADGVVKVWDVRMVAQRQEILTCSDTQRHPVNCSQFDPSGQVVAVGTNDSQLKLYSAVDGAILGNLEGHQSSVQVRTLCSCCRCSSGRCYHPTFITVVWVVGRCVGTL
jgi:WD40 repeat protein